MIYEVTNEGSRLKALTLATEPSAARPYTAKCHLLKSWQLLPSLQPPETVSCQRKDPLHHNQRQLLLHLSQQPQSNYASARKRTTYQLRLYCCRPQVFASKLGSQRNERQNASVGSTSSVLHPQSVISIHHRDWIVEAYRSLTLAFNWAKLLTRG